MDMITIDLDGVLNPQIGDRVELLAIISLLTWLLKTPIQFLMRYSQKLQIGFTKLISLEL